MRDTVKATIKQSFDAYSNTPRDTWMSSWPGQVVLAVDCMYWTAGTAAAIVRGTLGEYANQLTQQLMQVSPYHYIAPWSVRWKYNHITCSLCSCTLAIYQQVVWGELC